MEFKDYFRTCIELIEEAKIEYLIIGGIAVGVFGEPRFTQDVDIIIFKEIRTEIISCQSRREGI